MSLTNITLAKFGVIDETLTLVLFIQLITHVEDDAVEALVWTDILPLTNRHENDRTHRIRRRATPRHVRV